jgi:hypothetical protein
MSSRPLEDMYPFLDRSEYKNNLYVDEVWFNDRKKE